MSKDEARLSVQLGAPWSHRAIHSTESFDTATAAITPDEVRNKIRVSASIEQHIEWLAADIELGFEQVFLHNLHRDQQYFIAAFAKKVIPALTQ